MTKVWKITTPSRSRSWFTKDRAEVDRFSDQGHEIELFLKKEEAPLSIHEQKAVLADLQGIDCLINYHDCKEVEADAIEPGWGAANGKRSLELLALGREIIARDPEIWTESQKKPFELRYSEKVAKK